MIKSQHIWISGVLCCYWPSTNRRYYYPILGWPTWIKVSHMALYKSWILLSHALYNIHGRISSWTISHTCLVMLDIVISLVVSINPTSYSSNYIVTTCWYPSLTEGPNLVMDEQCLAVGANVQHYNTRINYLKPSQTWWITFTVDQLNER